MRHIWLMMAILAFANAINWASVDEWKRAAMSSALGAACYVCSELPWKTMTSSAKGRMGSDG